MIFPPFIYPSLHTGDRTLIAVKLSTGLYLGDMVVIVNVVKYGIALNTKFQYPNNKQFPISKYPKTKTRTISMGVFEFV